MQCTGVHWQPEFDIAEEYTEVLSRQFIVLLGVAVFPLITVMAVASFAVEYVSIVCLPAISK